MAPAVKTRRNLWPFDSFRRTTIYRVKRGTKETSTARYKGHTIYREAAGGFTVPSLDRGSVFDDKRQAKRFIDHMIRYNGGKKNPGRRRYEVLVYKSRNDWDSVFSTYDRQSASDEARRVRQATGKKAIVVWSVENPGGRGAFKRCVAKVSEREGVFSPRGVCAAAARAKYGAAKFQRMAAAGRRRAAAEHRNPPRHRRNSLEAAKKVYRDFHGRDPQKTVVVKEKIRQHKYLSGIGDLVSVEIRPQNGRSVIHTVEFGPDAVLAQNEQRTQLFIRGGDQKITAEHLAKFGVYPPFRESEVLGTAEAVSYYTRKDHLRPQDGGEAIYRHRFGGTREIKTAGGQVKRKRSPKPTVLYDTVNKLLSFAGGGYSIPDEGIDS